MVLSALFPESGSTADGLLSSPSRVVSVGSRVQWRLVARVRSLPQSVLALSEVHVDVSIGVDSLTWVASSVEVSTVL